MFRIGMGYDIHRLVPERPLILGGVDIPFEKGLLGHSDADALIHAVMDSLLGALALGDIGSWFPDSDSQYRGISSMKLLELIFAKVRELGYRLGNLDTVIFCEKPRLAPHRETMRLNLAQSLNADLERVSVKAGTNEQCDAVGRGEAIACQAVVLLEKVPEGTVKGSAHG